MGEKAHKDSMKIVPPGKKKCVWMEAGVVSYKLCDNNYDCSTCVYDQGMQLKVSRHKEAMSTVQAESSSSKFTATWVDKMMQLPASQRKCRYMITGEVGRKICPNAYECGSCSFDQMMQERVQIEPLRVHAKSIERGFELAEDLYYHEGHTWARPEYGGRVRVGIDDFAQRLLGRLNSIDLPSIGQEVNQGENAFQVIRNGHKVYVQSPIDGIISRVNGRLVDQPELLNESPYEDAWFFVVEPVKLGKNLKGLYYGEEAHQFIHAEGERLFSMANEDLRIAADGGVLAEDIFTELGEKEWVKVVRRFFKT